MTEQRFLSGSAVSSASLGAGPKFMRHQQGVALLVALVLLLMLTLLGLTSSNVAVMQERMTGNLVQSNEAFQLAESTLKAVESDVFDGICIGGGSGGFGSIANVDDLGVDDNDCVLAGYNVPTSAWTLAPAVVAQPGGDGWARYFIAAVPNRPSCSQITSNLLGGGTVQNESYIILASGRSATGISEAVVQSIYTCLQ